MSRYNDGRASEHLFNENLYKLYEILKPLLTTEKPADAINGALWCTDDNMLYQKINDNWQLLFEKYFKITNQLLSPTEPASPIASQLWLNNGVLVYYDGITWQPIKTLATRQYTSNHYEPFLLLNDLAKGYNQVVSSDAMLTEYIEETFTIVYNTAIINLLKGSYIPNHNNLAVFINGRLLSHDSYVESSTTTVTFKENLNVGQTVLVTYISAENNSDQNTHKILIFNNNAIESKFITTDGQQNFYLEEAYHSNSTQIEIYVNGRRIAYLTDYRLSDDNHSVIFNTPFAKDNEVLIYYIPESVDIINDKLLTNDTITSDMLFTQLTCPYVLHDYIYHNSKLYNNYTYLNEISFEVPYLETVNQTFSCLHIDPCNLSQAAIHVFSIDAEHPIINIAPRYTAFYGLGTAGSQILLPDKDYIVSPHYITLKSETCAQYSCVMAISYTFNAQYGNGKLIKNSLPIQSGSSFQIGSIIDPLCVFCQGLLLDDTAYTYNQETGYINMELNNTMDIGVIVFSQRIDSTINIVNENGDGIIIVPETYRSPLLFIDGVQVNALLKNGIFYVPDVQIEQPYTIVDCFDETTQINSYIQADTVITTLENETYIPIPESCWQETNFIVFVDGLLINQHDIVINKESHYIQVRNMVQGQKYVLLRNVNQHYIFSANVTPHNIALNENINHLMVYVENSPLCQLNALNRVATSTGIENELRCDLDFYQDLDHSTVTWYIFKNNAWEPMTFIDDTAETQFTELLGGFILDNNTFSILQNEKLKGKTCIYYGYSFDSEIEHPCITFNQKTTNNVIYYTGFKGYYPLNKNALSIYLDGIRQYPEQNDFKGISEISTTYFKLDEMPQEDLLLTSVIELPERNESKSCEYEILDISNLIPGSQIYRTNISLAAGIIRFYIDGLRQKSSDITVLSAYTFKINHYVPSAQEKILIEVRTDYLLNEAILPVRYAAQNEWTVQIDQLPNALLNTQDILNIYFDGIRYCGDYEFNHVTNSLHLLDYSFTERLTVNDEMIIEWR